MEAKDVLEKSEEKTEKILSLNIVAFVIGYVPIQ